MMDDSRLNPAVIKHVLDFGTTDLPLWSDEDLAGILAHQLRSPLVFDLADSGEFIEAAWREKLAQSPAVIETFTDLLHQPHAPVALLDLVKRYFKSYFTSKVDGFLQQDVAGVLYYCTIIAALVHARERITTLSDSELVAGLKWALAHTWIDPDTRTLLLEGLRLLCPDTPLT